MHTKIRRNSLCGFLEKRLHEKNIDERKIKGKNDSQKQNKRNDTEHYTSPNLYIYKTITTKHGRVKFIFYFKLFYFRTFESNPSFYK